MDHGEGAMFTKAIARRPGRSVAEGITAHPELGKPDYETALRQHDAYVAAAAAMNAAGEPADLLWPTLRDLRGPINAYFEHVLVNAEDETLRRARLALVQRIAQLPARVADLSKLQGF